MCKFHKDVARDIATNPLSGDFNAGQYSTALIAMALFRLEQYMPDFHGCDGFVPEQMLTNDAKASFAQSGLRMPQSEINAYRDAHIEFLQSAIALTSASCDLSMEALNIKDRVTKDGYKVTCCAEPDPTENGPFLDEAVVEMFDGYDDAEKTWATKSLSLVEVAHKPEFEALRMATEHFISQPGVRDTLEGMFERSVSSVFQNAQANLDAGLSRDSEGCVMCGHGSRRQAPDLDNV